MEISPAEYKNLIIEAARMGASIALSQLGIADDEIKEREAFRIYGEANVRSWCNQKLVKWVRGPAINSPHTYSRVELETVKRMQEKSIKTNF